MAQNQNELGAMMAAQNELAGLNAGRQQNSQAEQAFLQQQQAANAVMMQAAQIGTSGGGLPQQVGAMNPQTQALLAQYGVTGVPTPGRTTSSSKTTQSGNNIKVENNTTTNNDIKIINPPGASGGNNEAANQTKFQVWLSNAFAKQGQEYEAQRRMFARRDRDLEKQSNKMMREIEKSNQSLGEKLNPKTWAVEQGGEMKKIFTIMLLTVAPTLIKPIVDGISNLGEKLKGFLGLDGEGTFKEEFSKAIGIEEGQTFLGKLKEELFDLGNYIKEFFSDMMDDRKAAIQKAKEKHSGGVPFGTATMLGTAMGSVAPGLGNLIGGALGFLADSIAGITKTITAIPDYLGAAFLGLDHFTNETQKELDIKAITRQTGMSSSNRDFANTSSQDRYSTEFLGGTHKDNRDSFGNLKRGDENTQHEQASFTTAAMTKMGSKFDLAGAKQAYKYLGKEKGSIKFGSREQLIDWLIAHGYEENEAGLFIQKEQFVEIKDKFRLWYIKYTSSRFSIQSAWGVSSGSDSSELYCREYDAGQDPGIEEGRWRVATTSEVEKINGRVISDNPESIRVYYLTQAGIKEVENHIGKKYNNGKAFSFSKASDEVLMKMFTENQLRVNANNKQFDKSSIGLKDEEDYNNIKNINELKGAIYADSSAAAENLDMIQGIANMAKNAADNTGTYLSDKVNEAYIANEVQLSKQLLGGYYRVSGKFGEERETKDKNGNVTGKYTHKGIDFAVPKGTDISSPVSGKVIEVGNEGKNGYGKFIKIETEDGKILVFGHLSKQFAKKNQEIEKGEVIGRTGNTGRSTGAHLHFEVRDGNNKIDPVNYFKDLKAGDVTEPEDVSAGDATTSTITETLLNQSGTPTMSFGGGTAIVEFNKTALEQGTTGWEAVSGVKLRQADGTYKYVSKEEVSNEVLGGASIESIVNHQFSTHQYGGINTESDFSVEDSGEEKKIPLGMFNFYGTSIGEQNVINTVGENWDHKVPFWVTFTKDFSSIYAIYTWNIKTHIANIWEGEEDDLKVTANKITNTFAWTGNTIWSPARKSKFKEIDLSKLNLPKDTIEKLNNLSNSFYNPMFIIAGYYIPQAVWDKINSLLKSYSEVKKAISLGYLLYDEETNNILVNPNNGLYENEDGELEHDFYKYAHELRDAGIDPGFTSLPKKINKDILPIIAQSGERLIEGQSTGGINVFGKNLSKYFEWTNGGWGSNALNNLRTKVIGATQNWLKVSASGSSDEDVNNKKDPNSSNFFNADGTPVIFNGGSSPTIYNDNSQITIYNQGINPSDNTSS